MKTVESLASPEQCKYLYHLLSVILLSSNIGYEAFRDSRFIRGWLAKHDNTGSKLLIRRRFDINANFQGHVYNMREELSRKGPIEAINLIISENPYEENSGAEKMIPEAPDPYAKVVRKLLSSHLFPSDDVAPENDDELIQLFLDVVNMYKWAERRSLWRGMLNVFNKREILFNEIDGSNIGLELNKQVSTTKLLKAAAGIVRKLAYDHFYWMNNEGMNEINAKFDLTKRDLPLVPGSQIRPDADSCLMNLLHASLAMQGFYDLGVTAPRLQEYLRGALPELKALGRQDNSELRKKSKNNTAAANENPYFTDGKKKVKTRYPVEIKGIKRPGIVDPVSFTVWSDDCFYICDGLIFDVERNNLYSLRAMPIIHYVVGRQKTIEDRLRAANILCKHFLDTGLPMSSRELLFAFHGHKNSHQLTPFNYLVAPRDMEGLSKSFINAWHNAILGENLQRLFAGLITKWTGDLGDMWTKDYPELHQTLFCYKEPEATAPLSKAEKAKLRLSIALQIDEETEEETALLQKDLIAELSQVTSKPKSLSSDEITIGPNDMVYVGGTSSPSDLKDNVETAPVKESAEDTYESSGYVPINIGPVQPKATNENSVKVSAEPVQPKAPNDYSFDFESLDKLMQEMEMFNMPPEVPTQPERPVPQKRIKGMAVQPPQLPPTTTSQPFTRDDESRKLEMVLLEEIERERLKQTAKPPGVEMSIAQRQQADIERQQLEEQTRRQEKELEDERLAFEANVMKTNKNIQEVKECDWSSPEPEMADPSALFGVELQKALDRNKLMKDSGPPKPQDRSELDKLTKQFKLEQEKLQGEKLEMEKLLRKEQSERERVVKEQKALEEKIERERRLNEQQLEQERLNLEKLKNEFQIQSDMLQRERLARDADEKLERERSVQEKQLERETLDRQLFEREKLAEERRLQLERIERERAEHEQRLNKERLEHEKFMLERYNLREETLKSEKALIESELTMGLKNSAFQQNDIGRLGSLPQFKKFTMSQIGSKIPITPAVRGFNQRQIQSKIDAVQSLDQLSTSDPQQPTRPPVAAKPGKLRAPCSLSHSEQEQVEDERPLVPGKVRRPSYILIQETNSSPARGSETRTSFTSVSHSEQKKGEYERPLVPGKVRLPSYILKQESNSSPARGSETRTSFTSVLHSEQEKGAYERPLVPGKVRLPSYILKQESHSSPARGSETRTSFKSVSHSEQENGEYERPPVPSKVRLPSYILQQESNASVSGGSQMRTSTFSGVRDLRRPSISPPKLVRVRSFNTANPDRKPPISGGSLNRTASFRRPSVVAAPPQTPARGPSSRIATYQGLQGRR